jgi:hypothetical protein
MTLLIDGLGPFLELLEAAVSVQKDEIYQSSVSAKVLINEALSRPSQHALMLHHPWVSLL